MHPRAGRGWSELGCILQMRPYAGNFLTGRRQTPSHAPKSLTGPPRKGLLISGAGVITLWVLCNYLIKPPPSPQRGAGRLTRPCPPLSPRRLISSSCWEGESAAPSPPFLYVAQLGCMGGLARGRAGSPWRLPGLSAVLEGPVGAALLFCFEDKAAWRSHSPSAQTWLLGGPSLLLLPSTFPPLFLLLSPFPSSFSSSPSFSSIFIIQVIDKHTHSVF